ncbi:MAG: phage baseplate assembly protein V, partial [Rudaea sp.]
MEFYGKYRGKVIDNNDPLKRGRLRTNVPAISDHDLTWAEPCTPYAGPKLGWYVIPPAGANVWIEFERGDVDYPIWTGCFWGLDEREGVPPDAQDPEIKVFQTEKLKLVLDDKNHKLTAVVETDTGKMSLVMDKSGIVVTADTVTITATPDKIELKKTPNTIELAEDITLKKAAATIAISNSITLKNGAAMAELSQAAIDLKNGASSVNLSPATVSINNGALEVM